MAMSIRERIQNAAIYNIVRQIVNAVFRGIR